MKCVVCKKSLENAPDGHYRIVGDEKCNVAICIVCLTEYEQLNASTPKTFWGKLWAKLDEIFPPSKWYSHNDGGCEELILGVSKLRRWIKAEFFSKTLGECEREVDAEVAKEMQKAEKPNSFREKMKKECEKRLAECHTTLTEGSIIPDPISYQAGKKRAYEHILHLMAHSGDFAADPLAEFKAKLKAHITEIGLTGHDPEAGSLLKWIDEH